ncbi:hypothetical protein [Actinoplanes sp. CA-252034]|uniref:hypothetical protein n=1 Tax=Actinoplanes sp. CA-252034 TaxID=3239906 RepID=UPI003D99DFAD
MAGPGASGASVVVVAGPPDGATAGCCFCSSSSLSSPAVSNRIVGLPVSRPLVTSAADRPANSSAVVSTPMPSRKKAPVTRATRFQWIRRSGFEASVVSSAVVSSEGALSAAASTDGVPTAAGAITNADWSRFVLWLIDRW